MNVDVICHVMKYDLESLKSRPCYLDTSLTNRPISKSLNRSAGWSGDKYFSPPTVLGVSPPSTSTYTLEHQLSTLSPGVKRPKCLMLLLLS
jgi:hypothetical protein